LTKCAWPTLDDNTYTHTHTQTHTPLHPFVLGLLMSGVQC